MSTLGRPGVKCTWPTALVLLSCSLSPSEVPLQSTDPARLDVYFYGPHQGGKALTSASQVSREPMQKAAPSPEPTHKSSPPVPSPKVEVALDADGDAGAEPAQLDYAGRYLGTDIVAIQFVGVAEDPQVDDGAKVDVEMRGENRIAVTVVDSSQGTPLCTVEARLATAGNLEFEAGQPCFTGMLGIPIDAELVSGSGKLEGSRLSFELSVGLALRAPGGSLEGQIEYEFEGEKAQK